MKRNLIRRTAWALAALALAAPATAAPQTVKAATRQSAPSGPGSKTAIAPQAPSRPGPWISTTELPDECEAGSTVVFRWRLANAGKSDIAQATDFKLYLSSDAALSRPDDEEVGDHPLKQRIAAGQRMDQDTDLNIPRRLGNTMRYLIVEQAPPSGNGPGTVVGCFGPIAIIDASAAAPAARPAAPATPVATPAKPAPPAPAPGSADDVKVTVELQKFDRNLRAAITADYIDSYLRDKGDPACEAYQQRNAKVAEKTRDILDDIISGLRNLKPKDQAVIDRLKLAKAIVADLKKSDTVFKNPSGFFLKKIKPYLDHLAGLGGPPVKPADLMEPDVIIDCPNGQRREKLYDP